MKTEQLREKSIAELGEELEQLRKTQFERRMAHTSGQLPRSHELGQLRRSIARVKTVMHEKKKSNGEAQ